MRPAEQNRKKKNTSVTDATNDVKINVTNLTPPYHPATLLSVPRTAGPGKLQKPKSFRWGKNSNFSKVTPFVLKLNKRKPLSSTFNPQPPHLDQKTTKAISPLLLSHPPSRNHRNPPMQSNLLRMKLNTCIISTIKWRRQNKLFISNELSLSCKLATI